MHSQCRLADPASTGDRRHDHGARQLAVRGCRQQAGQQLKLLAAPGEVRQVGWQLSWRPPPRCRPAA
jgi:hypothetical protein